MRNKFAAQLYTLRNELKSDFPGVLKELKKMGWTAVQIDGIYDYDAEEIGAVLKELNMSVAGMHVGWHRMTYELDVVLEEARALGTKDIFNHYLEGELQNEEGYRQTKRRLLDVALRTTPLGYRIGYHHHDFEFHTIVDGKPALEYILEPEGNQFIYPEIDTYWVKKAGFDPLQFISKYSYRMPILHLKDMTNDERETFAEIGTGTINFKPIIQWGEANGVEWYAVEQDYCEKDPFTSLEISLRNVTELIKDL